MSLSGNLLQELLHTTFLIYILLDIFSASSVFPQTWGFKLSLAYIMEIQGDLSHYKTPFLTQNKQNITSLSVMPKQHNLHFLNSLYYLLQIAYPEVHQSFVDQVRACHSINLTRQFCDTFQLHTGTAKNVTQSNIEFPSSVFM